MSGDSGARGPTAESSLHRTLGLYWVSIVGVVLYVVLDAAAQSLPPHYSPIRDAESDLAVGPYGYIMAINFVNRGVLSLAFLFAFTKTVDLAGGPRAPFRRGRALLGVWAVGAILLAIFPTDVPATPVSWHGAIHLVVAVVAFIGGGFGVLLLSRRFGESAATRGAKGVASALGSLSVLFLLVQLLLPFTIPKLATRFGGLTERLFLGSVLLWILVVSVYMVSHRRSSPAAPPPTVATAGERRASPSGPAVDVPPEDSRAGAPRPSRCAQTVSPMAASDQASLT